MRLHKVFWSAHAPDLPLTISTALTMQRVDCWRPNAAVGKAPSVLVTILTSIDPGTGPDERASGTYLTSTQLAHLTAEADLL